MYRQLDPHKIVATVATLRERIVERFPHSGLSRVAAELLEVAQESIDRSHWIRRPILWLRCSVGTLVTGMLLVLIGGLYQLRLPARFNDIGNVIQVVEAGLNDIVLIGAGIFFLVTLENRIKRKTVLKAIHELRALAHIIDTHQLTKDPERLLHPEADTTSSPKRTLSLFELHRYLNYCSEMLAFVGKIAALHVQDFDDPVTLEAVDDIEDLTTGLARKIWQKIALLRDLNPAPTAGAVPTPSPVPTSFPSGTPPSAEG